MSDPKIDSPLPPPPSQPRSRALEFLNSNFGLALVGFVLTTLVGGFITSLADYYQRERQNHQQDIENARAEQLAATKYELEQDHKLRSEIAAPLLQRLLYTEMMAQTFGRPTTDSEFKDNWSDYWRAYRNYFLFTAGNEIPRDRGFGPAAPYLDERPVLWMYLTYVINPEFENIHACAVKAQIAYRSKAAVPNKGSDLIFKNCLKAQFSDHPFWISPWNNKNDVDPWSRFKMCVGTFVLQTEGSLVWREQLASEQNKDEKAQDPKTCRSDYQDPSRWCREMQFTHDVYRQMKDDCGALSLKDEKSLNVDDQAELDKAGERF